LIIQTIAGDIELFTRFSNWTNLLTPILIGVMFAKIKLPQIKNLQVVIYVVFAINYIFYGLIRSIGSLPYAGCGFIWDK
jgi:ABC-type siderophore export system fused ATPase/permease subunit